MATKKLAGKYLLMSFSAGDSLDAWDTPTSTGLYESLGDVERILNDGSFDDDDTFRLFDVTEIPVEKQVKIVIGRK